MLRDIRTNYHQFQLNRKDLTASPIDFFRKWMDEALSHHQEEPTAMTVSTSVDGIPDSRIVLLKEISDEGFIFYTNYESEKGKQLQINSNVALNFFWSKLERQIRIKGIASRLSEHQSEDYYHSRPKDSQLGAWASPQSQPIESREILDNRFKFYQDKYNDHPIDKPSFWGGYVVKPTEVEFWQGRPNRLHDRFRYYLIEKQWMIKRLAP